jgi:hypothetical protein
MNSGIPEMNNPSSPTNITYYGNVVKSTQRTHVLSCEIFISYFIYFRDRVGDTFRYNKFIDMALWFMIYGASRHFQQYFSYIVAVNFIGGRNQSTRRKPLTCRKSLCLMLSLPLDFSFLIASSGFSNVYLQAVNHIGKKSVVLIWAYRSI